MPPENYIPNAARPEPVELTVPSECGGLRLDQALSRMLPAYSRSRLTRWIRENKVRVDGHEAAPRHKVWGGERITVNPAADPGAGAYESQSIPLDIVYEDDTLLVVDKPAGMVVHPGSGNWRGTLLNALLAHAPAQQSIPRAGIVHRLDKDTSGLLVVAKTLEAQAELVRQMQARSVRREYLAVAHGRVARGGSIDAPIGRHPVKRTRMAVVARGRHAVTHYEVIERYARATLLRCRLETGRTHQIRVHLSMLGHPLLGDQTYGKRGSAPAFPRQALHARTLALVHPRSRVKLAWESPLPPDMERLLEALRALG
jgi:23S rRNA pseudouridine1911/1915/1917 synthase